MGPRRPGLAVREIPRRRRRRSTILVGDQAGDGVDTALECAKDGVATRLRCARCEAGICPACLVRTPVGYACGNCAGEPGGRSAGRSGLRAMVAGAVVLAALIGLVVVRSSGSGGSGRSATAVASSAAPADAATADAPPTREPMIGEEAKDGQLLFTVGDFTCATRTPPGDAGSAAPPSKLCQLAVTVTNISGSPAMLLGQFQYLVDAQSRTYGADVDLTRAVPENANRSITAVNVNPQVVLPLVLVYEIPDAVVPTEARFRGTGSSRFGINVRLQRRG